MHYGLEAEDAWEKNGNDKEAKEEENKKENNKTNLRCLKFRDNGVLLATTSDTSRISEIILNFIILKKKTSILLGPVYRADLWPKF